MSRIKRRKMDTAIVVALIGLAGTLITTVLSSPIIQSVFQRTPAPEGDAVPDGERKSVFSEDFEDGSAGSISLSNDEWQVANEQGSYVLEVSGTGSGTTLIWFGPNDFSDGFIEFRIYFKNFDGFLLNFRSSVDEETYTLYIAPESGEVKLGYNSADQDWALEPLEGDSLKFYDFRENVWYDVKVETMSKLINVWIGKDKILSSFDFRLREGGMEFAVQYDGTVLLDDIAVYQTSP